MSEIFKEKMLFLCTAAILQGYLLLLLLPCFINCMFYFENVVDAFFYVKHGGLFVAIGYQ